MKKTNKLILIGGLPGSGKSFIGKKLLKYAEVFIDKDTVTRHFTEALLLLLGCDKHDRESEIYLSQVKDLEYETILSQAMENLELKHNVICSAPFISQFRDSTWLNCVTHQANEYGAEVVKIWIHTDENTAKERITARGAKRDTGKLLNWDTYMMQIKSLPAIQLSDLIVIDNSPFSIIPLIKQLECVAMHLK